MASSSGSSAGKGRVLGAHWTTVLKEKGTFLDAVEVVRAEMPEERKRANSDPSQSMSSSQSETGSVSDDAGTAQPLLSVGTSPRKVERKLNPTDGKLYTYAELLELMDNDDSSAAINYWKTEMLSINCSPDESAFRSKSLSLLEQSSMSAAQKKAYRMEIIHKTVPVGTKCIPCPAYLKHKCRFSGKCGLCHDASHRKPGLMSL
mmetsp:Transcript_45543/g.90246  ORF Transcript_45543/g.90246 Transcript_45543/m.90246 type:complete len:204 (+) Transcript_45543:108-719(+)|eukprot:CAMPEP_0172757998 /NCGR_PEP_ID=MMETSP1074-20121228/164876_1 /TAXON_ID=2916 /ORGANISM="Ceratium fusus, Strain PA161109" /LENGTH=203 /DNA_ID=CAMNT_0013591507 /DNA_START=19 /DNA_END=630 /DNA_ORIENTATION=+